eukprot:CAMPEP_0197186104 /NCGR_PEP_ID=MMETSP1423-20130617/13227_1 /TAXON_ID=476441 /ORGANISM="Pseudo-nitzschia heimii, Strain UNC1101" /LENGTH=352 /DNA_ID=CAMNT_0042637319 /DNA_START=181 /DNA_END=1239 /DNA_ORIENTATION=+
MSGNQQSAVALGTGRHKKTATGAASLTARRMSTGASNVNVLEQELQQKAFVRRANISHGCKQLQLQNQSEGKARMKNQHVKRKLPNRPPSMMLRKISEPEQKTSSSHSNGTKLRKKRFREANHQHIPEAASHSEIVSQSQLQSQSQPCGQSADANSIRPRTRPQQRVNHQQNSQHQPEPAREKEAKTRRQPPLKIEQDESNQQHDVPVKKEHQIISDDTKNDGLKIKPETVVIDLLSSDSEGDDECTETDLVLTLTQLLRNEAIGRGANPKEMQRYARQLFRLGLHSKQMILDALDFDTNNSDSSNDATYANTDMASGIVNRWEWMKPFHKTIFHRWIKNEQHRQRKASDRA